jgi:hypothetical protein
MSNLLLLHVVVDYPLLDIYYMLSLPTLNHIQVLQCRNYILCFNSRLHRYILDRYVSCWIMFCQQVQKNVSPVASIGNLA